MINTTRSGQWIDDDGSIGTPDPSNFYRYVGNHPTYARDPSGLAEEPRIDYGDWTPPMIPLIPPLNNKRSPNTVVIYDGSDDGEGDPKHATGVEFKCAANWIIGPQPRRPPDDISSNQAINVGGWVDALDKLYSFVTGHGTIDRLWIVDHSHGHHQEVGKDILRPADFGYLKPLLAKNAKVILLGCSVAEDRAYLQAVADTLGVTVLAYDKTVHYAVKCDGTARPFWPDGVDPKEVGEKHLIQIQPK